MKDQMQTSNQNIFVGSQTNQSTWRCALLLMPLALAWLALSQQARAICDSDTDSLEGRTPSRPCFKLGRH